MNEPTTPKVDDGYWFEWSKNQIDNSIARRDAQFDTVQKLTLWLWGVYTTLAATGFVLSAKKLDLWATLAIGSASVLLIAVYWISSWGGRPVPVKFDPRSPTKIRDAHGRIVRTKDRRLLITAILSALAATSVAASLMIAAAAPDATDVALKVLARPVDNDTSSLAVSTVVKKSSEATIAIVSDPGTEQEKREEPRVFLSNGDGSIQTSVQVGTAERYLVRVTWQEGGVERSLARLVDTPDTTSSN